MIQKIETKKRLNGHADEGNGAVNGSSSPPGARTAAGAGIVVTDLSLTPIAVDPGAADILSGASPEDLNETVASASIRLPPEVLEFVTSRQSDGNNPGETTFRSNGAQYTCRVYQIDSDRTSLQQPVFVLHFEKGVTSNPTDAVYQVAADYGLTEREQEALVGISLGLTSKELAKRMNISPNTVRAFLRLIMIKMDVSTRGGIVAKILDRAQTREAS